MLSHFTKQKFIPILMISLFFFVGCRLTHNQTIIPKEWQIFFNATPVNPQISNFNKNHLVLIAIIDSGTDYNHPLLQSNIHYKIDKDGKVLGTGWDFIGNDSWPLPYLARTRFLYQKDEPVIKEEEKRSLNITHILEIEPQLSRWLHQHRLHDEESSQKIYHGTHTAGLASYDDPRIGILPYRILPNQESIGNESRQMMDIFYENLEAAIKKAISDGASVISLSLGTSFGKSDRDAEHSIELFKKFETLVNSYPQIIFVAAAGNENTWVNGQTRYSFPCGVSSKNIVCVASMDKNGFPSEFTNIPLIDSPLVFAPGEQILAPIPDHYCHSTQIENLTNDLSLKELKTLAKDILKECDQNNKNNILPLSGTSMATPMVARVLAQEVISLKPKTIAEDVIKSFISKSEATQLGGMSIAKILVPIPHWYPKYSDKQRLGIRASSVERGYFTLYIKK